MNDITKKEGFSLAPSSYAEAMEFSEMLSRTEMIPKDYRGKPANILVAIQMGSEVGLPPLASLQNIAVINGRPSIYGDSLLAIVQGAPQFISCDESFDPETNTATCKIKRQNRDGSTSVYLSTFSQEDAVQAGLWGKTGPWKQYSKRMLQMRARGFCCRDSFADRLRGLSSAEESNDLPPEKDITPAKEKVSALAGIISEKKPFKEDESIVVDAEDLAEEQRGIDLENVIDALDGAKTFSVYEIARDAAIEHANAFSDDQIAVREAILRCKTKLKEG